MVNGPDKVLSGMILVNDNGVSEEGLSCAHGMSCILFQELIKGNVEGVPLALDTISQDDLKVLRSSPNVANPRSQNWVCTGGIPPCLLEMFDIDVAAKFKDKLPQVQRL